VLSVKDLGTNVQHGIETAYTYMRWYFRISHPYLLPTPVEDPPRLPEHKVLDEIVGEHE
jgi:hypothetical protein